MTIGILETGFPPGDLRQRFGGYAEMVRIMLGSGHDTQVFDVQAGVLPASPAQCSGYVITGSPAGVYDDLPWIAPLLGFLRQARGQARLAGICFGHQAMAQAFGGQVVKSDRGWGVGLHRYGAVSAAPWMELGSEVAVPAFHQDQVVVAPPGAVVVARSDFTPFAALRYGTDAISFQCHPEFDNAFATALVQEKRDVYGPAAAPAIRSFELQSDAPAVGGWIARFLAGAPLPS